MSRGKFLKSLREIIFPEVEPGIITNEMLKNAYLHGNYRGEEERLHCMEPVEFKMIKQIRLEQKNILRISNLWILTNLTKLSLAHNKIERIIGLDMLVTLQTLNLSFNYIHKIENLDKLVNLEELSLFSNMIVKIEALSNFEKLIILSLGNNKISSVQGIERLRFLKNLRALNLEGNNIAEQQNFRLFIAIALPQVKYYAFQLITDEEREKGADIFKLDMREIYANEENETRLREKVEKEKRDADRLASSFCEHLNERQLYQSLWDNDEDGRLLMLLGDPAEELTQEYDDDMFEVTQEIYKIGLQRLEERQEEIDDFMTNLEEGQREIQEHGQKVLEQFIVKKDKLMDKARFCVKTIVMRSIKGEDEDAPEHIALQDKFYGMQHDMEESVNIVWQVLMGDELHVHESIEEVTVAFQRKIQEMISKFVEKEQVYFAQLREISTHFAENMTEITARYVTDHLTSEDFDDVPKELMFLMEDREAIMNLISGMKDSHTQKIDEREDRLITRSRDFIQNLIDDLNKNETLRHRGKIHEINTFLDKCQEDLNDLPDVIFEKLHKDM